MQASSASVDVCPHLMFNKKYACIEDWFLPRKNHLIWIGGMGAKYESGVLLEHPKSTKIQFEYEFFHY